MSTVIQRICLFAFLSVILAVGMGDAVFSFLGKNPPGNGREPNMPFPPLKTQYYWNRNWTTDYEAWLKNRSWLIYGSGAIYRELAFGLAQRTPSTVIVGKNGWFFLPEVVEVYTAEHYQLQAESVAAKLVELRERYRAQGIELVVLIIPSATTLFPEQMPDWVRNKKERLAFLPALVQLLQAKGINVLSGVEAMQAAAKKGVPVYFKGDNHWTYLSAQAVAEATAEYVRKTLPEVVRGATDQGPIYSVRWSHLDRKDGALNRRLAFWKGGTLDRYYADAHEKPDFVRLRSAAPLAGWSGTSFSDFGTPEFFANALGAEVDHYNRSAKGILYSTGWGLKHCESNNGPKPRVVVLEIPEYQMTEQTSRSSVFDRMSFGIPPWSAPSVPVAYEFKQLTGLAMLGKSSETGIIRLEATDKNAVLQLNVGPKIKDLEVALVLNKVHQVAMIQVRGSSQSKQICYDGDTFLKYRFAMKKPTAVWNIAFSNLTPGQILEIGEARTLAKP